MSEVEASGSGRTRLQAVTSLTTCLEPHGKTLFLVARSTPQQTESFERSQLVKDFDCDNDIGSPCGKFPNRQRLVLETVGAERFASHLRDTLLGSHPPKSLLARNVREDSIPRQCLNKDT